MDTGNIHHGRYLCTELKQFTTTHISEEREMSKWRVKEALPRQQCKSEDKWRVSLPLLSILFIRYQKQETNDLVCRVENR